MGSTLSMQIARINDSVKCQSGFNANSTHVPEFPFPSPFPVPSFSSLPHFLSSPIPSPPSRSPQCNRKQQFYKAKARSYAYCSCFNWLWGNRSLKQPFLSHCNGSIAHHSEVRRVVVSSGTIGLTAWEQKTGNKGQKWEFSFPIR